MDREIKRLLSLRANPHFQLSPAEMEKIEEWEKAQKHVNNKTILDDFFKNNNNVYYYALVNKGFFKKKELYLIDMYTKNIYIIENNEVVKY